MSETSSRTDGLAEECRNVNKTNLKKRTWYLRSQDFSEVKDIFDVVDHFFPVAVYLLTTHGGSKINFDSCRDKTC